MLTRRDFLKDAALLGAAGLAGPLFACGSSDNGSSIIIRNGTVFDGTTAAPVVADVAICGDRIAAVGNLSAGATRIIDARGCIVAPGFIDVHDHTDSIFQLAGPDRNHAAEYPTWVSNEGSLLQGVTTVISGNCGYGYSDMNEYYTFLNTLPFASNTYYLTAHGQIRQDLFGDDQPEALTPSQLMQMKRKVAAEMAKGALGMSTGLGYTPGARARLEELVELGRVLKAYNGIYATHIRNDLPSDFSQICPLIMEGILEAIEVGRQTRIPVQISHIKGYLGGDWAYYEEICRVIEAARAEGIDVTADQYPFIASATLVIVLVPTEYRTATALKTQYWWQPIIKEKVEETFKTLGPGQILITSWKTYDHQYLSDIAQAEGKSPSDIYLEMVSTDSPPTGLYYFIHEGAMEMFMTKPYVFTGSDGGAAPVASAYPHPRSTATFARKLKVYAKVDTMEPGLLTPQNAILSMTSRPAEKFRLTGRGKLLPGYYADICVIDPATLDAPATYLNPSLYSKGIRYVLVNGVLEVENGAVTGRRSGRTLRRTF